ncbi:protein N-terminal asparagine amidohydrolase [Latimeria chalumnae]|uniref:protein N-terminal asparagine amidohydrolase n=1 Tax=Latimeria chalumnae TaxID=7897 RepID=UPI0003C15A6E|nr:PREDICTED: protein N-terminal asparagine amidohydrolase isoform X1 [Latimeria chalumnae]|eukprot:XP_006001779.1 PREDICTED: protein N-terminal asparagine amidohydrolase isoform X1 [Latimeria chalumnae]
MPLIVNNSQVHLPRTTAEFIRLYSHFEESAKAFRSRPTQQVEPRGLLYVQQREFAATTPQDGSVSIIGSEDATTCHLVVLRHTGSGAVCLAHCDGSDAVTEVSMMVSTVKSLSVASQSGRLELHLVGGFIDDRRLSQKLTLQLLGAFDCQLEDVHLVTYCVTELNDVVKKGVHWPIIYGIAVDITKGEIFPAAFPDKSPDEDLRSARTFTGGPMINIYDAETQQLKIKPCFWFPFPDVDFWLAQKDEMILKGISTSPLVEPSHFVPHLRSTLRFLKEHPIPDNLLFPDGQPRIYKKNVNGLWERSSTH